MDSQLANKRTLVIGGSAGSGVEINRMPVPENAPMAVHGCNRDSCFMHLTKEIR